MGGRPGRVAYIGIAVAVLGLVAAGVAWAQVGSPGAPATSAGRLVARAEQPAPADADDPVAAAAAADAACLPEPHPCGEVWPVGLHGPFTLKEVREVSVTSHDGTVLDGWVALPDLPPGVGAPVILQSTPYLSTCMVHPTATACLRNPGSDVWLGTTWWEDGPLQIDQADAGFGRAPIEWIRLGYAIVEFNLRGTGASGGCLDVGGRREQLDQKALVDWAGSQPWSNGRVAMGGLSYPGGTTWQAAVQAPSALKAIVSVAPITDYYTYHFTPQGALLPSGLLIGIGFWPQYTNPPVLGPLEDLPAALFRRVGCAGFPREPRDLLVGYVLRDRDSERFEERDLLPRVGDVRAAVLHAQGYNDGGHYYQDTWLTSLLADGVPFREVRGWWGHEYPNGQQANRAFVPPAHSGERSWPDVVEGWLEYWLKGVGPVPPLGVDHLDQSGTWHRSTAWPPPEARDDVRHLTAGRLARAAGTDVAQLTALPTPLETAWLSGAFGAGIGGGQSLCAGLPGLPAVAAYSATAVDDVVVAGNPSLELDLTSSLPVGSLVAQLYAVGPGFTCSPVPSGAVTWLASGGLDLERLVDRYERHPSPVGVPLRVHVDLTDVTARIPAGHSLVVVLGHGDVHHMGDLAFPTFTISGSSSIAIPVLQGRLAG